MLIDMNAILPDIHPDVVVATAAGVAPKTQGTKTRLFLSAGSAFYLFFGKPPAAVGAEGNSALWKQS